VRMVWHGVGSGSRASVSVGVGPSSQAGRDLGSDCAAPSGLTSSVLLTRRTTVCASRLSSTIIVGYLKDYAPDARGADQVLALQAPIWARPLGSNYQLLKAEHVIVAARSIRTVYTKTESRPPEHD